MIQKILNKFKKKEAVPQPVMAQIPIETEQMDLTELVSDGLLVLREFDDFNDFAFYCDICQKKNIPVDRVLIPPRSYRMIWQQLIEAKALTTMNGDPAPLLAYAQGRPALVCLNNPITKEKLRVFSPSYTTVN